MKKLVILSISIFLFCSCKTVFFDRVQPVDGKILSEFPKEYQGVWKEKDETSVEIGVNFISTKLVITTDGSTDEMEVINIPKNHLSDSLVLVDAGEYLVLNFRDEDYWRLYIAVKTKSGDIVVYSPDIDEDKIKQVGLEEIPQPVYYISAEGIETDIYLSGALSSKNLKYFVSNENIIYTLKKDGTILFPDIE